MSTQEPNFSGWTAVDKTACDGGLVFKKFEPKPWNEDDVDGTTYKDRDRGKSRILIKSLQLAYSTAAYADQTPQIWPRNGVQSTLEPSADTSWSQKSQRLAQRLRMV